MHNILILRWFFGWRSLGLRGVASIEFAMIASLMVMLVLGTVDIGYAVWEQMVLQRALRVGGQMAVSVPTQTALITAAFNNSLPQSWPTLNPPVTVTPPCGVPPDCSGGCTTPPDGQAYVMLSASRPFSALIISSLSTNAGCYVVRVQ